jgi:ABC-type multidrug transport system fused ATPase/permease subunit
LLSQESIFSFLGFVLVFIFFLKAVFGILITRTILNFTQQQQIQIQNRLMAAYLQLPYSKYINRNSSEYIVAINNLTPTYAHGVVMPALRAISDLILFASILTLLAVSYGSTLVPLIAILAGLVFAYDRLFRRRAFLTGKYANEASRQLYQAINEGIRGLKEVRILGQESFFLDTVSAAAHKYGQNLVRSRIISSLPKFLIEFILVAFIVSLTIFTFQDQGSVQSLLPTLGVFAIAAMRLGPSATNLAKSLVDLRVNRNAVSKIYADLSRSSLHIPFLNSSATTYNRQGRLGDSFECLKGQNLYFQYPGRSGFTLQDVSFSINAGDAIGVIGPSGSGKTTLIDIVLGLLGPNSGELLLNGQPLADNLSQWRSWVAYLPQQMFLIDNSLKANITLGTDCDNSNADWLEQVIERAQLGEMVRHLPDGLESHVGEGGIRLSGGQRQRISLARALYFRRDVLILDEATNALDKKTEDEVVDQIYQLKGQQTSIVIAHSASTLRYCDRIYRLEYGLLEEFSTYDQFLRAGIPQ